jgi:hypothetical protein
MQFLLSSIHVFIKLRALSIQKYDVEITTKKRDSMNNVTKNNNKEDDIEYAVASPVLEVANEIQMSEVIGDIEQYSEEVNAYRVSVEALRLSHKRYSTRPLLSAPKLHTTTIEFADENLKVLQNQLQAHNLRPLEYIPLYKIRERLQVLTTAVNRGEMFDENEFDHLLKCMDVNEEYIQEQKEKERLWREQISAYAQECLHEQRQFIPPDIFLCTQTQLVNDKGIPVLLAKRLMQKKCLWLTRMSEVYIGKLHVAELQGKYGVAGNNLDIVETLAIYACVPVKFPNDGNGKKALWKKTLEDSVKKLMASKDNNTLSTSQLRNPAYKNHIGSFTGDELYNPDMTKGFDEARVISRRLSRLPRSVRLNNSTSEVINPIQDVPFDATLNENSDIYLCDEIMLLPIMTAEEKSNIQSQLLHVLSKRTKT